MLRGLIIIAYIVVGFVVANAHHYFASIHNITQLLSAVLAVVLWPLVALGISMRL